MQRSDRGGTQASKDSPRLQANRSKQKSDLSNRRRRRPLVRSAHAGASSKRDQTRARRRDAIAAESAPASLSQLDFVGDDIAFQKI